jgi:hypothetical protein
MGKKLDFSVTLLVVSAIILFVLGVIFIIFGS